MLDKFLRSGIARNTEGLAVQALDDKQGPLGVIQNCAVVTRGEALGHGVWLDQAFLDSIAAFGNQAKKGVKARFTHPGLSSDGLGKFLGRGTGFYTDGDVVRCREFNISRNADGSPDGKLGSYVLGMVEEDPEALGISIVFKQDQASMDAFVKENSDTEGRFISPDPLNELNLPHARAAMLRTMDVVDEPAANPNGMFSDGSELAMRAESMLLWATGMSEIPPSEVTLGGLPPEKLQIFWRGFVARHREKLLATISGEAAPDKEAAELDETEAAKKMPDKKCSVCPDCGAEMPDGGTVCPQCGPEDDPIEQSDSTVVETLAADQPETFTAGQVASLMRALAGDSKLLAGITPIAGVTMAQVPSPPPVVAEPVNEVATSAGGPPIEVSNIEPADSLSAADLDLISQMFDERLRSHTGQLPN